MIRTRFYTSSGRRSPLLILGLALFIFCGGCEKVSVRPKPGAHKPGDFQKPQASASLYRKDGPGGLFKNIKWYQYDTATHIIWPFHDIYALKTPLRTYLVQVQSYYADQALTPGSFKLAVKSEAGTTEYLLDGRGCGNPYTNPDFEVCSKDPEQNVFVYLDLDTGKITKMSESEALKDTDWDLGVRAGEIRLNSGPGLPGQIQGALAQRFDFYFSESGEALPAKLRLPELKNKALAAFAEFVPQSHYDFYMPEGIDRVLHESFWMTEDQFGRRTAINDVQRSRWWIVRTQDGESFAKLQIPLIEDDQRADGGFDSRLHFRYLLQTKNETSFGSDNHELVLDLSTQNKLKSLCLRLEKVEVLECAEAAGDFDLKFTAIHRLKSGRWTRDWLIFTSNGAIGPLTHSEAETWTTGRP